MSINQYDKLLRLHYLKTSMSPLRLTRLSRRDVVDHIKLMGLKDGQVRQKLCERFCLEFGNFN